MGCRRHSDAEPEERQTVNQSNPRATEGDSAAGPALLMVGVAPD